MRLVFGNVLNAVNGLVFQHVHLSLTAHFHHVIELLRFRQGTLSGIFLSAGVFNDMSSFTTAQRCHCDSDELFCSVWSTTVFQFSYTAVFGAYTAFIFIRTGEFMFVM